VNLLSNQTREVSAPKPNTGVVQFERLPQLELQVYEDLGEFTIHDSACVNVLSSGSVEEKMDIVFLPEDYTDLEKFEEDVKKYIDLNDEEGGIFSVEPFKSNKEKFNFYYINRSSDLECKLGCFGVDRLVCCNDDRVKEVASQCPYDQAVVLVDTKEFCGASKDYASVCTIEDERAGLVLVHELGHTIGGLGDEYSYGRSGKTEVPNCDVAGCSKWAGIEGTGCYETCGYTNLFRPTLKDSLMNLYIPQFGPVSINRFLQVLSDFSTTKPTEELLATVPLEKSYVTNINYLGGELSIEEVYVVNSTPLNTKGESDYTGIVSDFEGKALEVFKLKLPRNWYSFYNPAGDTKGHIAITPQIFEYTLNIPYFNTGALLELYDLENTKVEEIKLSPFAEVCGDNICQENENYLTCEQDCSLSEKDNVCLPYPDDNICDPDCPKFGKHADSNCKQELLLTNTALIAVLIFALALLINNKEE